MQHTSRQEFLGALRMDNKPRRLRKGECRLDEAIGDELGEAIGHPHGETQRPPGWPPLHRVDELAPQGEDLVSVTELHPAHLGETKIPSRALEQLLAEGTLEGADLPA